MAVLFVLLALLYGGMGVFACFILLSFYSVVGLPVQRLYQELGTMGELL